MSKKIWFLIKITISKLPPIKVKKNKVNNLFEDHTNFVWLGVYLNTHVSGSTSIDNKQHTPTILWCGGGSFNNNSNTPRTLLPILCDNYLQRLLAKTLSIINPKSNIETIRITSGNGPKVVNPYYGHIVLAVAEKLNSQRATKIASPLAGNTSNVNCTVGQVTSLRG